MNSSNEFNLQNLVNGLEKINRKIVENYLDNASGYNHDIRDICLTYFQFFSKLFASPTELFKVLDSYLDLLLWQEKIWRQIFSDGSDGKAVIEPAANDKRFIAAQWTKYPFFNYIKQNYLLAEKFTEKLVNDIEMDEEGRKKLNFYAKQYSNLLSPSNFLLTNPEAIELAFETNGKSLWQGFENFIGDLDIGRISQVDGSAFEVGKNIAITKGSVIFQNELIQLIQYNPTTEKVHQVPLLIIPPWINKYYVFDLRPENSLVKYLVDQGFSVFIISWRNPVPGMGYLTFDDYAYAALNAVNVVKEISNVKKINALGYCLGGTLLSVVAAILASQKKEVINTLTFLATMIDFTDIGPMGDVIDKALVKKFERNELLKEGLMHGHDMERAFDLIRVNDLVWNYAVNNYLKGQQPKPFDVMYWTNDNTNLPAKMYLYYIKEMIWENKLSQKNALTICDTKIDIGKITAPSIIIAFSEDYISPPKTVYTGTRLLGGPVEFILGESGHVMGVVNPPSKNKYGHYLSGQIEEDYTGWKKTADYVKGSWWKTWIEKLTASSGEQNKIAEEPGNKKYKALEAAPGKYASQECHCCFKKEDSDVREEIELNAKIDL